MEIWKNAAKERPIERNVDKNVRILDQSSWNKMEAKSMIDAYVLYIHNVVSTFNSITAKIYKFAE